jgi:23S rRNA G2069 N7-methylase RlmK/C1962 C5-methylase RlmI
MKTLTFDNKEWALIMNLLKKEQDRLNCKDKDHLEYYFLVNSTLDEVEGLFSKA